MVEVVDYCGLSSGAEADKSSLFDVFYGDLETAPMVSECPLNLECRFSEVKELGTTSLIIGEITEVFTEKKYLTGDTPDCKKMDPMIFFMPGGPYYRTGEHIGDAFAIGKDYRPKKK